VVELIRARAHGARAHVVGLSLGAQLAAHILGTTPEALDHAVLSGCLTRAFPGMKWLYPSVGWMYKMYEPYKDAAWLIRANMQSAGIPEKYFAEVREDTRLLTADALAHILTENMAYRPASSLSRASVPTLVLAGQNEYGIMRDSAHDLAQALPNAKAFLAPKAGHTWNFQSHDLFTRTVRAWITAQPLPQELLPLT
jgi:pimeloyl-ACP methyl ester carboxylesterase